MCRAILLCVAALSLAEVSLRGTVRDAGGLLLPGATVALMDAQGQRHVTTSREDGGFSFAEIPAGRYRLQVTFPGFDPHEETVDMSDGGTHTLHIVLALSGLKEEVAVRASAADVPLDSAVRAPVDRSLIETLSGNSASGALSSVLTLAAPGVAADSNGGFHPLGEHAETSFSVDNQPIADQQSRTFSNQLSANAIQSLEILTGVPPAEFGDKTSLVVKATTRSGLGAGGMHGAVSLGYASFGTPSASLSLGVGGARAGNFLSIDGGSSGRFLDTPERQPLHADGHVFNFFDRFDVRISDQTVFQVNLFAAQSAFQTPNTYDQDAAGQDQRQRQWSVNVAPSFSRTLGSHTAIDGNAWLRGDRVAYDPSADVFADRPAMLWQRRALTNAGMRLAISHAGSRHTIKGGVQSVSTWLDEKFQTGLTDPAFNPPCGSGGCRPDDAFIPGLLPFDLTRGGALFDFHGAGRIAQWSTYLQDAVHFGRWDLTAGVRADTYDGLSRDAGLQPRLGVSYRADRTNTVWRASYGRIFLTPYNENLVLSSSSNGLGLGHGTASGVMASPLTPARRDQVDVAVQQHAWRGLQIDAEYFWKLTRGAYDFDMVLNTPLAFPVQFHESKVDGGLVRVTLAERGGWRAFTTLSHTRARLFGPAVGGLRFSGDYAPVARPDHDQAFQQTTHVEYRRGGRGRPWAGVTWRYDSGLVAVSVPTYDAALLLTGDEQAAIALYCGDRFASRAQPIRACDAPVFGALRIRIPAPGTENDDRNPSRIAPRHLVDLGGGFDAVALRLSLRLTVTNAFDTVALYNFLSTFSGTHFVAPRALRLDATVRF
jgi:hypothetical protein